jgi:CheY-like chemotaxis protein
MQTAKVPEPVTILVAEDDDGHAQLIRITLDEAGVRNPVIRFVDGEDVLDFLLLRGNGPHREAGRAYVLLLDMRMPKMDGDQVLERIKASPELQKLPVVMLTTTDEPRVVERCYRLGCNCFVTKPLEVGAFFDTLRRVGLFLQVIAVPPLEA